MKDSRNSAIVKIIGNDAKNKTVMIATDDKYINQVIAGLSEYSIGNFSHLKETLEDYFMSYYKEDKNFGGALQ